MKKVKLLLFVISMAIMALLITIQIGLHQEWSQMQKEYAGGIPFAKTLQSMQIEKKIFNMDMGISFLGFVNVAVIVFYFATNYQHFIDRWRKWRGKESQPLMATSKPNSLT